MEGDIRIILLSFIASKDGASTRHVKKKSRENFRVDSKASRRTKCCESDSFSGTRLCWVVDFVRPTHSRLTRLCVTVGYEQSMRVVLHFFKLVIELV